MTSILDRIKAKTRQLFEIDFRALALMRVSFALILLFDLVNRLIDLQAFYTDYGILPRAIVTQNFSSLFISINFISGSWQFQAVVFACAIVSALALLVGYRTRLATFLSWFFLISIQNRNPLILQDGDILLHLCLFFAIFLPWEKLWSVDSLRKKKIDYGEKNVKTFFSGATAAFLIQVALVYLFSALIKSGGMDWKDGTAIYYALHLSQFSTSFGRYLLQFAALLPVLTFAVFWLELVGPFLLFSPLFTPIIRTTIATAFIFFQLGLASCMHLGPFPWVSLAAMLAFFPSSVWDHVFSLFKTKKRLGLKIYYDGDCGFCKSSVDVIKTFFLIPGTFVATAESDADVLQEMKENDSWVIVDAGGGHHFKFDGFVTVIKASPLLFLLAPLAKLPGISLFGDKIYEYVSEHRSGSCSVKDSGSLKQRRTFLGSSFINIVSLLFIVYVILWNLSGLGVIDANSKTWNDDAWIAYTLRLDQEWNMFAPDPLTDDGWYVIPGDLADGSQVDLFRGGAPVTYAAPADVAALYRGERWRKYMMNLWQASYSQYRLYYGRYLCRSWNDTHPASEQLLDFQIIFMLEETLPNYEQGTTTPTVIWNHHCF